MKNSNPNIVVLPESFNRSATNFTLNLKDMGEVKVDFKKWSDGLVYHFGLHGYVGETGYRSLHLFSQQLQDFKSPEDVAEFLALGLYESEGKNFQKQVQENNLKSKQLSLF